MSAGLLDPDTPALPLALTVNRRRIRAEVEPRTHLADFLRDRLDLTGTHLGCEHGICGACTILLDGEPARSCLTLASGCGGAEVTTIEGLDDDEVATELRAAFTREHALQCGYCTPGMLVTARDLVLRLPEADERRVRLGLSGNLCRCTGYVGIVRAVMSVVAERRARGIGAAIAERSLGPVGAHAPSNAPPRPVAERRAGAQRRPGEGDANSPVSALPLARSAVADSTSSQRGEGIEPATDFTPAHTFDQHFTVPFPPDEVFALFGRVQDVATCLPGATITAQPSSERIEGAIRVRLGPISAAFRGAASIGRDEATRSGRIVGRGEDTGGRSSTQGIVAYRVLPGDQAGHARVELSVGYTLKGALAQFGRPGLVRDLAGRITAEFARNIEARLAGGSPAGPAPDLDTLSLVRGLLRSRIQDATAWLRAMTDRWPFHRNRS